MMWLASTLTRRLGLAHVLRFTSWLVLSALAFGCEPEAVNDADVNAEPVVEAGVHASGPDASGGATGLDATSVGDGSGSASASTAPAPLDATGPHAAAPDSARSDAVTWTRERPTLALRMAERLPRQRPTLEPSTAARGSIPRQSPTPARPVRTGSADSSSGQPAQAVRSRSGEMRWDITDGPGTEYCSHQSIALWKEETLTLNDPASPGFRCSIFCPRPPDLDAGNASFTFRSADMEIHITFRSRVMLGYSLRELSREPAAGADVRWTTTTTTNVGSGVVEFQGYDHAAVEFLSYQAPVLHVRMQTSTSWTSSSFPEKTPVPYLCFGQTPAGPTPRLCTDVACEYHSVDNPVIVTIDLALPIRAALATLLVLWTASAATSRWRPMSRSRLAPFKRIACPA
jgi:hypothetical protein